LLLYVSITALVTGGYLSIRPDNFLSRSVVSCIGSCRDVLQKLLELPRNIKQACLLSLDMLFVTVAMWSAVALRYGHFNFHLDSVAYACGAVTIVASAIVFLRLGLYRAVIRFMGQQAIWAIITAAGYSTLILGAAIFFTRADVPRSTPFIYWVILLICIGGTRLAVRAYYQAKLRALS
jgi:FlaA1/EpsC-like NDP-sugar epimerase